MGEEIAENEQQVMRASYATIFTTEIVSTLLASIISYAFFAHTQGSPLALELSHRWLFFLTMFTCCLSTISCFSSTLLIFASLAINFDHEDTPSVTEARQPTTFGL